jgi:integrase
MTKSTLIETEPGCHELRLNGSRVKIRETRNKDYKFFRLHWKVGSRSFRRAFSNAEKAIDEAERIVRDLSRAEGEKTTVRSEDVVYYRECARKLGSVPLHEAVEFYMKFHRIGAPRKTLAEIADEFLKSCKDRGVSKKYVNSITFNNKVWKKWAGAMAIPEISATFIERKFAESTYTTHSKKNLLRNFRALELFAIRQKYVPKEFDSAAEHVKLPPAKNTTPAIFTPEELMRLLVVTKPHQIAYVATMAFAGARRAEFERMTRDHFSVDENVATINAEIAKKGSRRVLELPENLRQWLDIAELPAAGKVPSKKSIVNLSADKARLREVGLTWKQNVLRHSFCSYHLALHRNAALTSELAGNSPQMLRDHYKSLVTPAAAKEWFDITPQKVFDFAAANSLARLLHWNLDPKGAVK